MPWTTDERIVRLPDAVRESLLELVAGFSRVAGPRLVCLAAYGGVARGDYIPGSSDLNLIAVFSTIDSGLLDSLRPIVTRANRIARANLMMLEESDLAVSAEVFPIKLLDIQRHHLSLAGNNLLKSVAISPERLRRQCLRQIQNARLRLRTQYLLEIEWPERLHESLRTAAGSFLFELATVVELGAAKIPSGHEDTLKLASDLGLDVRVIHELRQPRQSVAGVGRTSVKETHDRFQALLLHTARRVETT